MSVTHWAKVGIVPGVLVVASLAAAGCTRAAPLGEGAGYASDEPLAEGHTAEGPKDPASKGARGAGGATLAATDPRGALAAHAAVPGAAPAVSLVAPAPAPTAPPPRSPFAYADDDPDNDLLVAPPDVRPTCEADLKAAGVSFAPMHLAVHKEGKRHTLTCGAEQVVLYKGSPAGIRYSPPPLVTCTMALALARFETVAQEEAEKTLGSRIVRIEQLGTYACREMANYPGWVSEHSYANAIDLAAFTLKNGKRITVLKNFEKAETTKTREGAFLRVVSRRAFDEEIFSTVLTPFFDPLHNNHFHVDLARYKSDGTRPEP